MGFPRSQDAVQPHRLIEWCADGSDLCCHPTDGRRNAGGGERRWGIQDAKARRLYETILREARIPRGNLLENEGSSASDRRDWYIETAEKVF